ncbi:ABC transporter substrate-binding protein [uncultured Amnibacterium sp.]|uniref:ABC transporter substrate-binding protein n=1 Tax=uncultured Amnibacterium sp. TaxID=1631851 RepID=UPI0035CC80AF
MSTVTADANRADLTRLDVSLVAPVFNNVPLWVADRLGRFADAGLDVRIDVLFGVENVSRSLLDGSTQIAIGTPESVLSLTSPSELIIVGGNASKLSNALIARRGIGSIGELRGGVIGVSHTSEGTGLLVREMMSANGLHHLEDYELRSIGVASRRWEAILDGTIDAGLQTSPHRYLAEQLGFPSLGQIADYVPDYQFTTINVRRDWAETHADALRRFTRCVSWATAWMSEHREATIAIASDRVSSTEEHAALDYDHFRATGSLQPDLQLSAAGMANVVRLMDRAGTLRAGTPEEQARRIDLSYLPQV